MRLVVAICTSPRVGQNAVLGSLRHANTGAGEGRHAHPVDGVLIRSLSHPQPLPEAERTEFVRLTRTDRVAQAISFAVALQTGRFHSWQERTREPEFNRLFVEQSLARIEYGEQCWDEHLAGRAVLCLNYEHDIAPDPCVAAQRILRWVGLSGSAGPTDVVPFDGDVKRDWRQRWESL